MRQGEDSNPDLIYDMLTYPACVKHGYGVAQNELLIPSLRQQLCFSYKAKTKRKAAQQDTHYPFCLTMETSGQRAWLSPPAVLAQRGPCGRVCFIAGLKLEIAQPPRTKVIVG